MQGGRVAVLIAMALVSAACGGGSEREDAQPPPPTTTRQETTTTLVLPKIEEPPPTARQLVGTWARIGIRLLFRFGPDGTWAFDRVDLDHPYSAGTYELRGNTVRFTNNGPGCIADWSWKAGIAKAKDPLDDELRIVFVHTACDVPAGVEWTLARVEYP